MRELTILNQLNDSVDERTDIGGVLLKSIESDGGKYELTRLGDLVAELVKYLNSKGVLLVL